MDDQPRWPRGTPVGPSGKGPGGGRFRDKIGGWASAVAARLGIPELEQSIESGIVSEEEISVGLSDAKVHRVQFADGTYGFRKNFGTGPNWQGLDPDRQADAEQLASVLGRAIGAEVAHVSRTADNEVIVRAVEGEMGFHYLARAHAGDWRAFDRAIKAGSGTSAQQRLGVLDILIENQDRSNPGNWFITPDGRTVGIDHAGTFRYEAGRDIALPGNLGAPGPFAAQFVMGFENPKFKSNPLTRADAAWLLQRVESLRPVFEQAGRLEWYAAVHQRVMALSAKARGQQDLFAGQ